MVKNLPENAGDARDVVLNPGSGRSPEGGPDSPLQFSCHGQGTVHGQRNLVGYVLRVAMSQTQLNMTATTRIHSLQICVTGSSLVSRECLPCPSHKREGTLSGPQSEVEEKIMQETGWLRGLCGLF